MKTTDVAEIIEFATVRDIAGILRGLSLTTLKSIRPIIGSIIAEKQAEEDKLKRLGDEIEGESRA